MNRRTLVLITGILVLAGFAAAAFFYNGSTPAKQQARPEAPDVSSLVRFHSPVFGPANAPVTIVEFFDPSCEACRAFYPFVKNVLAEHPNDVRLVFRYALFHQGSEEVARMLETARKQDVYVQVLEAVLAAQPGWHDDPHVLKAWEAAAAAGLDVSKARAEMGSPSIDAVLSSDMADVKTIGIRATPTFFVNGKPLSEFGPEPLLELVKSEIEQSKD